ncbi:MAG: hypothetical protein HY744_34455 [Deltaproteobacteria bacterium]|nr:hypothetical protein [Deltaproteobacteria bacterium]
MDLSACAVACAVRPAQGLRTASLLVAGGLLALGACSGDGAPGGAGGSPPATELASTECGACVTTACAGAISECQTDPGCAGYLECLLKCPVDEHGNADQGCDEGCASSGSSETARLASGLTACRLYGDGASCKTCAIPNQPVSGTLNQQCEPRPEPAPTPCRQCYWDHCCDTWDACFAEGVNPDCDALATCIQECKDPIEPCVKACFAAHPGSVATLLDRLSCATALCAPDTPHCEPAERDACQACLYDDCADPFAKLLSTAEGFLVWLCTADCGAIDAGSQCIEGCVAAYPDATEAFFLWAECVDYACATVC